MYNYIVHTLCTHFVKYLNLFFKGVENSIRHEVWKYLLGYYPWNSTREQRILIDKHQKTEYERMKVQWMNMSSDQISRFNMYRDRKSLIGKYLLTQTNNC